MQLEIVNMHGNAENIQNKGDSNILFQYTFCRLAFDFFSLLYVSTGKGYLQGVSA